MATFRVTKATTRKGEPIKYVERQFQRSFMSPSPSDTSVNLHKIPGSSDTKKKNIHQKSRPRIQVGRFDESVMFRGSRTTLVEVIDEASLTSSEITSPEDCNSGKIRSTFINELNMHSLPSHLSI